MSEPAQLEPQVEGSGPEGEAKIDQLSNESLGYQLWHACQEGNIEYVQRGIKEMLARKVFERASPILLDRALAGGDLATVSCLIQNGAETLLTKTVKILVTKRSYQALELLFEAGWDINAPVKGPEQPPILAFAVQDFELTEWLLERGASPNAPAGLDITPLSLAFAAASFNVIDLLLAAGGHRDEGQLLHWAAARPDAPDGPRAVQFLLDCGADPNALEYADHEPSRRWLLRQRRRCRGKEYELLPSSMGTPLHAAARTGHAESVRLLLAQGADPRIADADGRLPVEVAEERGDADVVRRMRRCEEARERGEQKELKRARRLAKMRKGNRRLMRRHPLPSKELQGS